MGKRAAQSLVKRGDANENARPRGFSRLIYPNGERIPSFDELRTGNAGIEGRQG